MSPSPLLSPPTVIACLLLVGTLDSVSAPEGPPQPKSSHALRSGDTVALISPASPMAADAVRRARSYLERRGYKVRLGKHLSKPYLCDLSGKDDERLEDLNGFLRDPNIRAVMTLRGGYGSPRLLDGVDYEAIKTDPKILTGFSDITALHLAVYARTGQVTFHSPALGYSFGTKSLRKFTERSFWSMLDGSGAPGAATFVSAEDWQGASGLETWAAGRATGALVGGNLSIVAGLEGTPYALPRSEDVILFLEEVGEPAYRIDRMLTQLRLAGAFKRVRGIVLGAITAPRDKPTEKPMIRGVLRDRLGDLGVPILRGVPVGHQSYNMTLAHGARVELDAGAKTLHYLDAIFEETP